MAKGWGRGLLGGDVVGEEGQRGYRVTGLHGDQEEGYQADRGTKEEKLPGGRVTECNSLSGAGSGRAFPAKEKETVAVPTIICSTLSGGAPLH